LWLCVCFIDLRVEWAGRFYRVRVICGQIWKSQEPIGRDLFQTERTLFVVVLLNIPAISFRAAFNGLFLHDEIMADIEIERNGIYSMAYLELQTFKHVIRSEIS